MKTLIISIGLCLVGLVTMAQNVDEVNNAAYVNKRGVYLLPQAGDFALGIDATPFLDYLGNIFSGSYAPYFGAESIYGKYFLEDNRALRARLTLGLSNISSKGVLPDDDGSVGATVMDIRHASKATVELGVGLEFRRGRGRVQGFYGGEVFLGFGGGNGKYDYGNRMTSSNPDPTTFDFDSWLGSYAPETIRPTKYKDGITFNAGIGGFIGVEYFVAPQMSIGGELTLGLGFKTTGQGKTTYEKWDTIDDEKIIRTYSSEEYRPEAFSISFYTYPKASIFLMFHF